jgi:hypothetical protein
MAIEMVERSAMKNLAKSWLAMNACSSRTIHSPHRARFRRRAVDRREHCNDNSKLIESMHSRNARLNWSATELSVVAMDELLAHWLLAVPLLLALRCAQRPVDPVAVGASRFQSGRLCPILNERFSLNGTPSGI